MKRLKICFTFCLLIKTLLLTACGTNRALPLSLTPNLHFPDASLEINILDTGASDAILIESTDTAIIIDSGMPESESILLDFIFYKDIHTVDYLVFTHPTEDYMERIHSLLNYVDVKNIYHPNFVTQSTMEDFNMDFPQGIAITPIDPSEDLMINTDGMNLTITSIFSEEITGSNPYTLIASLQYSNQLLLFAGDASDEYLNKFLLGNELEFTIIKLPHQFVNATYLEAFLNSANPTHGILTSKNRAQPNSEILQLLSNYNVHTYFTRDGRINIRISPQTLNISQQLNQFTFM